MCAECCGQCLEHQCAARHSQTSIASAVCCSVLQCVAVCYSVLQCVAVCCRVLQSVAECCYVLQYDTVSIAPMRLPDICNSQKHLQCVEVCCSVLQSVAVCCSVLQCVAMCHSVLQCDAVSAAPIHVRDILRTDIFKSHSRLRTLSSIVNSHFFFLAF